MTRYLLLLLISSFIHFAAQGQVAKAEQFAQHLMTEQLQKAYAMCGYDFKTKVRFTKFEAIINQADSQLGKLKSWRNIRKEENGRYTAYRLESTFENGIYDLVILFSVSEKVVSFTVQPFRKEALSYDKPAYAAKTPRAVPLDIYVERYNIKLPGTLIYPEKAPKAVVVFVHGSGPNDRDATIGPNKLFKDLALGLASNGIASYRYDKRSFISKAAETCNTIDKEVTEDALSAVKLLAEQAELKNVPIYIIGHSLGGMMAPRIAHKSNQVKGIVLLGANAYPLQDLLLEQYAYLISLGKEGLQASFEQLKEKIARLKQPILDKKLQANQLPLGLPVSYWQSILDYDQVATAKALDNTRILVLNGKRDYQVSLRNFDLWQASLGTKATFKAFDRLNHLFIAGEGQPNPQEYATPGHVSKSVLDSISTWIEGGQ